MSTFISRGGGQALDVESFTLTLAPSGARHKISSFTFASPEQAQRIALDLLTGPGGVDVTRPSDSPLAVVDAVRALQAHVLELERDSEVDALAAPHSRAAREPHSALWQDVSGYVRGMWRKVAREALKAAEEVTTAEELDALPPGAIVLDLDGDPWKRGASGVWWYGDQSQDAEDLMDAYGPVTVLLVPEGGE